MSNELTHSKPKMRLILDPITGIAKIEGFSAASIGAVSKAELDSQAMAIATLTATIETLAQQANAPKTYDLTITNATST